MLSDTVVIEVHDLAARRKARKLIAAVSPRAPLYFLDPIPNPGTPDM